MIKKTLAALAFAFISASAFAQYGTWGYNNTTHQWLPPGVEVNNNQAYSGGQAIVYGSNPVYVLPPGAAISSLSGLNDCKVWGGVAGLTLGSLNKAHPTQAAILLGIGGAWAANRFLCNNNQGQSVLVVQPQAPAGQAQPSAVTVYAPKGAQGDSGYTCAIEGEPEVFLVKDRSTCSRLAGRIAQAKVGNTPSAQPASNRADPDKPWGHRGAAGICYLTQELKGEKPASCLQVSVVAANDGESMSSWKARLP